MVDPNEILAFLEKNADRPLKPKDLARHFGVSSREYREFRDLLRTLEAEGKIYRVRRGRYAPPGKINLIVGRIGLIRNGAGFVTPDGGGEDIFVPSSALNSAWHDDRVVVRLGRRGAYGRPEGEVIKVLARARTEVVGTVEATSNFLFVVPDDPKIPRDVYVPLAAANGAKRGDKVLVEIVSWGSAAANPEGRITEILGRPGDLGLDVLLIVKHYGLPTRFAYEVERETEALPGAIPAEEIGRRTDFRDAPVVTIDPADAKDHDDALHARTLDDGTIEVGVHIADVSHYVGEGSAADLEALARGTSVYLVDRVIPMLPERLSNDLCSLKPRVDRLASSVLFRLDETAAVLETSFHDSVIRSRHRMSYDEAQRISDGDPEERARHADVLPSLLLLFQLTARLREKRMKRGGLDFDLPESRVLLDEEGLPLDIQKVVRLPSHRLVEELMLLANEAVARRIRKARSPSIYRIHEPPDPQKLEELARFAGVFGYRLRSVDGFVGPKSLQRLLEEVAGRAEEGVLSTLVLRSMKRARYSARNVGHYGLALLNYTHFTSPIRRYPDLVVHRVLREVLGKKASKREDPAAQQRLEAIAERASDRERVADDAERDSVDLKKVEFMARHLGDEFEGIVSGVQSYGFFVELERYHVEGLVHVNSLEDDYYIFREDLYALIGEHSRRAFRLGDRVRVQVVAVKLEERKIDFQLLSGGSRHTAPLYAAGPRGAKPRAGVGRGGVRAGVRGAGARPKAPRRGAPAGAPGGAPGGARGGDGPGRGGRRKKGRTGGGSGRGRGGAARGGGSPKRRGGGR